MKQYNKRTWLNKLDSPSLGSVVAFDGMVNYDDGPAQNTYLAISDCRFIIKIQKNTESMEDFIDKLKLLNNEIDLFINYLQNKK